MERKPRLYYRTKEQIAAYRKLSVRQKLEWLEAQMEFFHKAMTGKAKKIRDRLTSGEL